MTRATLIETELGTERLCSGCNEFWPNDAEFFFMSKGQPTGLCKACFYERHQAKRVAHTIAYRARRRADAQVAA